MPTFSAARRLLRTYTAEAGSSPTSTTARPGRGSPRARRASTRVFSSSSRASETRRPSRMRAVIGACGAVRRSGTLSPIPHLRGRSMANNVELEAAAFRRLLRHLNQERTDVQNIDLMILAGFCRNCLADWYREAAAEAGQEMDREQAREAVYGMPFAEWKARHQREATPEQLAAFEAARRRHG